MNKILVVGSKDPMDQEARNLVSHLGQLLMERHCILLGGCANELDTVVAKAAATYLKNHGGESKDRICSWITSTAAPAHNVGNIIRSRLPHWSRSCPEAVANADAVEAELGVLRGHGNRFFGHNELSYRLYQLPVLEVQPMSFGLRSLRITMNCSGGY